MFRRVRHDGAQNLAALQLRGLLFLFRGLGMKRAGALQVGHRSCNRHKGAVIRNCQPRTNRQANYHAARGCIHIHVSFEGGDMSLHSK